MAHYHINKGINKPIEFKGLKAQYIGYLAAGLVILLLSFTVMYLLGTPIILCMTVVLLTGSGLFYQVFKLSHTYGEHGLMKKNARRYLPTYLHFRSRIIFTQLKK